MKKPAGHNASTPPSTLPPPQFEKHCRTKPRTSHQMLELPLNAACNSSPTVGFNCGGSVASIIPACKCVGVLPAILFTQCLPAAALKLVLQPPPACTWLRASPPPCKRMTAKGTQGDTVPALLQGCMHGRRPVYRVDKEALRAQGRLFVLLLTQCRPSWHPQSSCLQAQAHTDTGGGALSLCLQSMTRTLGDWLYGACRGHVKTAALPFLLFQASHFFLPFKSSRPGLAA